MANNNAVEQDSPAESLQPETQELILGFTRDELNEILGEVQLIGPKLTASEQLEKMGPLEKGWYGMNGIEGEVITAEQIQLVKSFLEKVLADDRIPEPSVYPDPDGGVRLEWANLAFGSLLDESTGMAHGRCVWKAPIALDAEFDFTENKVIMGAYGLGTSDESKDLEVTFKMDAPNGVELFTEFFGRIFANSQKSSAKLADLVCQTENMARYISLQRSPIEIVPAGTWE